jgi:hypothetical protein
LLAAGNRYAQLFELQAEWLQMIKNSFCANKKTRNAGFYKSTLFECTLVTAV